MEDIIHLILINISLYRALLTPKPRSAKPHPPQRSYGGNRGLGIFPSRFRENPFGRSAFSPIFAT